MRAWKLTMDTSSIGELFCCSNHDELYLLRYKIWCAWTMDILSIGKLFILLFKSRRTIFVCYKIWCVFHSANIPWTSEMTTWSPKKFNNFVTIKNNTMLLISFMWLWMSNKCVSCKNSERLLRKWQKKLQGISFFTVHCAANSHSEHTHSSIEMIRITKIYFSLLEPLQRLM